MMKRKVFYFILLIVFVTPLSAQTPTEESSGDLNPAEFYLRQWAADAEATSEYDIEAYSAQQATGAPDVSGCLNSPDAWASRESTGVDDLTLYYDIPVIPLQITIYQTSAPGAITGIDLLPFDSEEVIPLENSTFPETDCPGVVRFDIEMTEPVPVRGIVIHVDQTITESWNEIDAVELVGLTDLAALEFEYESQWAADATATSQYSDPDWSALQATGAPDTLQCGDYITAWASANSNGIDDLTVTFKEAMIPIGVNIYQTYNPGAITGIELISAETGDLIPVPNSADPGTNCPGTLFISLADMEDLPAINGVVIHLDQTLTESWNEIDAVELIGVNP